MTRHLITCTLILTVFFPFATWAFDSELEQRFYTLQNAIRRADTATIRANVTRRSLPTVERLLTYKLEGCLPEALEYTKERRNGDYIYVTISTPTGDNQEMTSELAFKQEDERWKLDVPESFRNGWGEEWAYTLDQIALLYETIQNQFGGKLQCDVIRDMFEKNAPPSSSTDKFQRL